jgi:hypothetical protein
MKGIGRPFVFKNEGEFTFLLKISAFGQAHDMDVDFQAAARFNAHPHAIKMDAQMIHTDACPGQLSRSPSEKEGIDLMEDLLADEEDATEPKDAEGVYCRQCLKMISTRSDRMAVQGAHQHTFANPHGILFEIGCYKTAPGCIQSGPPTEEFSWFKAYSWQVAICRRCLLQVGWFFSSARLEGFYGLILDRLFFPR